MSGVPIEEDEPRGHHPQHRVRAAERDRPPRQQRHATEPRGGGQQARGHGHRRGIGRRGEQPASSATRITLPSSRPQLDLDHMHPVISLPAVAGGGLRGSMGGRGRPAALHFTAPASDLGPGYLRAPIDTLARAAHSILRNLL